MSGVYRGYDVVGIGYSCIDYITTVETLPRLDEKITVDGLLIQGGGLAATAMVAVARLGGSVALITTLADDGLGSEIADGLEEEGVDISLSPVREGSVSAFAFVMIEKKSGLRTIIGRPPAGEPLTADDIDEEVIRNSKVLLIDGTSPRAQRAAALIAREARVPVLLDAEGANDTTPALLELTDVLIASREFGESAGKSAAPDRAAANLFSEWDLRVAAVTAGADGAFLHTAEGPFRQRAFKVAVVDTTGAGDAFHGAYAYAMSRGRSPGECARFAAAVAALKCRKLGGRTGLPRLNEVEEFLEGNPAEL
ncbi:MAG: carbohydrate kinase family protein [Planctomycetota bacterium]|jgi:ribokinase